MNKQVGERNPGNKMIINCLPTIDDYLGSPLGDSGEDKRDQPMTEEMGASMSFDEFRKLQELKEKKAEKEKLQRIEDQLRMEAQRRN
jgi:hypothetical protein